MASDTTVYSLAYRATMTGEDREPAEMAAANPVDIDTGAMIHAHDGTEDAVTAFTRRRVESLDEGLAEIRRWAGGLVRISSTDGPTRPSSTAL